MNILIDTNIFIHLEDHKIIDESFINLYNLCTKFNHTLFIHPASIDDIKNDKNKERMNISLSKIKKYQILERSPVPNKNEIQDLHLKENSTNDKNDNLILFALYKNSVNILLTEDIGIVKKARQLGIVNRVLHIQEALHSFNLLHQEQDISYPEMSTKYLYELNKNDNLFNSLKSDYLEFDNWFERVSRERRKCWIHSYSDDNKLSGILIYKEENNPIVTIDNKALNGKILKISTFKIAEHMQGFKLGELFVKTAFNYANKNKYQYIYLTTRKDKQDFLVNLIEDFGFYHFGICDKNRDDVYIKDMTVNKEIDLSLNKLNFYKRYSPFVLCEKDIKKFIVPIKPKYHDILFPELEDRRRLFYTNSTAGNTIKKAYLSHANTNEMDSGDLLLFYRSQDRMAITTLGIVEKVFKTKELDKIVGEVAKRTVYSYEDISIMSKTNTHVILFRLIDHFDKPFITKQWMEKEDIYKNCQSICKIENEIFNKIIKKGNLNYCIEGDAKS